MKSTPQKQHRTPARARSGDEVIDSSLYFPADMVVSRTSSGEVASRFGDDVWDMSFMSTDGSSRRALRFFKSGDAGVSELGQRIRRQQKALMWLHMDAGKLRSWSTLSNTNFALVQWCTQAELKKRDLFDLLSDPASVAEHSRELNLSYLYLTSSALKTLWRHRQQLGAPMDLKLQELRQSIISESLTREEYRQTPLIPSRIYCAILSALNREMDQMETELDALLHAYATERKVSRETPKGLSQWQLSKHRFGRLNSVRESMDHLGYTPRSRGALYATIRGRISRHQVTLLLAVVAYTGMRKAEASILPLENCLKSFEFMGSSHYEVIGFTHKLSKGVKRPASWITSRDGVRAIRLAQRIGRVIVEHHAAPAGNGQQALLFASPSNPYRMKPNLNSESGIAAARLWLCPSIEMQDIVELDRLELERGWERDGIAVGNHWPLTLHQLRRSLAVYAHRSGMVSLPALKAQLQHITQEMSAYYADGFSKATNLVFDPQHISHAWHAAKAESSYFAYALGVLFSDDELLGQGVERMAEVVETRTKKETLALFAEGKVAFRETVLGGCISTEACESTPLDPIPYDCLESNCVNMVVLRKRLDLVIKSQEGAVALLEKTEPGSVEHRLEAGSLEVLLRARSNFRKKAN